MCAETIKLYHGCKSNCTWSITLDGFIARRNIKEYFVELCSDGRHIENYIVDDCKYKNPKLAEVPKVLDYGTGFYLTSDKNSAECWARDGIWDCAYVREFMFIPRGLNILNLMDNDYDEKSEITLALLLENHSSYLGYEKTEALTSDDNLISCYAKLPNYEDIITQAKEFKQTYADYIEKAKKADVIIGPRFDSRYRHICNDYFTYNLNSEDFSTLMDFGDAGIQYAFMTDKSMKSKYLIELNTIKHTKIEEGSDVNLEKRYANYIELLNSGKKEYMKYINTKGGNYIV